MKTSDVILFSVLFINQYLPTIFCCSSSSLQCLSYNLQNISCHLDAIDECNPTMKINNHMFLRMHKVNNETSSGPKLFYYREQEGETFLHCSDHLLIQVQSECCNFSTLLDRKSIGFITYIQKKVKG